MSGELRALLSQEEHKSAAKRSAAKPAYMSRPACYRARAGLSAKALAAFLGNETVNGVVRKAEVSVANLVQMFQQCWQEFYNKLKLDSSPAFADSSREDHPERLFTLVPSQDRVSVCCLAVPVHWLTVSVYRLVALCNGLLAHCRVHEFPLVQVARDLGLMQDGVKYLKVAATLCRRLVQHHHGVDWGKDSVRAMRVEIVHGVEAISLPGETPTQWLPP